MTVSSCTSRLNDLVGNQSEADKGRSNASMSGRIHVFLLGNYFSTVVRSRHILHRGTVTLWPVHYSKISICSAMVNQSSKMRAGVLASHPAVGNMS